MCLLTRTPWILLHHGKLMLDFEREIRKRRVVAMVTVLSTGFLYWPAMYWSNGPNYCESTPCSNSRIFNASTFIYYAYYLDPITKMEGYQLDQLCHSISMWKCAYHKNNWLFFKKSGKYRSKKELIDTRFSVFVRQNRIPWFSRVMASIL